MKTTTVAVSVLTTIFLSACTDSDPVVGTGPDQGAGTVDARLKTFNSGDEFYGALRDALLNQGVGSFEETFGNEGAPVAVDSDNAAGEGAADVATAESSAAPGDGSSGNDVTSTNVQEVGVDEQDRVKVNAAGTRLLVLSNNYHYQMAEGVPPGEPEPAVVDDIPVGPGELEDPESAADGQIGVDEGAPADSVSLPFGSPAITLRILALDSETPDATAVSELDLDLDGRSADGFYLYEGSDQVSAIITASGGGYWGYWDYPTAFQGLQSVIAKVDVTDANNPVLADTFTLDGQVISSRRIGDALFFASRYYPAVPDAEPWEQGSEAWRTAVENADMESLMPSMSRDGTGESTRLVDPSNCFVAPLSSEQEYYSPDIITLGVIDLDTMELRDSECFLGSSETLYANSEAVFLATTQYDYSQGPVTLTGTPVDTDVELIETDVAWFDPRSTTEIHRFDITDGELNYAGSGSVRGHLGWNELQKPFRMSERNGYLRVATMNDQQGPDHSPILLNILQSDGQGNLTVVSSLPNDSRPEHIGKPGEQLYASRFLGDRAYLVTFRQTDPLYIVDLSDPSDPQVTGELEIEGYSDYLHPVGEDHLLGIGRDAVALGDDADGRGGAFVLGIKLALFDISDPALPTEVTSLVLGEQGTYSEALYNHRAITIQPANDLHPMRVSFGANVYGDAFPTSSPTTADELFDYPPWSYTGLHGFDVTSGANANIVPRGALVIERNDGTNPYGYPGYGDDRAVMVNNAVYYVHGAKVYPALWDTLGSQSQAR